MRKFETRIIVAGPGTIADMLMPLLEEGTWEIKAAISSNATSSNTVTITSPMVRVFLQREIVDEPEQPTQYAVLEEAGQETLFCSCCKPAGAIGTPNCVTCGKVIKK
jgi:stalled ribosome rescue protein Dom34